MIETQKFCSNCGNALLPNDSFCGACGNSVSAEPPSDQPSTTEAIKVKPSSVEGEVPTVRRQIKTKVLLISLAICMVAGISVLAWVLLQKRAAEKHFELGEQYNYGRQGYSQDYVKAAGHYRKAAQKGYVPAQYNLGAMYEKGHGVPRDYSAAVKWYQKAADQGHPTAQFNLGVMYNKGRGIQKDYAKALMWYRKAANQADLSAENNLGSMYEKGHGVPRDYRAAVKWYRKAADQGHPTAQYNLGRMYERGRGVKRNYGTAIGWYRKAAAQGYQEAQKKLKKRGRKPGKFKKAYLGVLIKQHEAKGMRIVKVVEQSPARRGGLLPGDVILELEDHRFSEKGLNAFDFFSLVSRMPVHTPLRFLIERDGRRFETWISLKEKDDEKAYVREAERYLKNGRYDMAIRDLNRAIQLDPKYVWAYGNRGEAYRQKGLYDRAIWNFTKAIDLSPEYKWAYGHRGEAYRQKGFYDMAIRDLTRAIQLDPKYEWAHKRRRLAQKQRR